MDEAKVMRCQCGNTLRKRDMLAVHEVRKESVPLSDYNDLTPSNLIEYIEKRRFVCKYLCPRCKQVITEDLGSLF